MEARFGEDFSAVRIHDDERAHESALQVSAHAYTIGSNIVFQRGGYDPHSRAGRSTLAHELTHVVQQRAGPVDGTPGPGGMRISDPSDPFERAAAANAERVLSGGSPASVRAASQPASVLSGLPSTVQRCGDDPDCGCVHSADTSGQASLAGTAVIQRACLSGAVCVAPPGSSTLFGGQVESREDAARKRRKAMSPARQVAHGHTGHARALEHLLESQAPGLLANIHGIFIDQDMDPEVAASTQDCADMIPPITGATKPCV